jgi:hypothetical protein
MADFPRRRKIMRARDKAREVAQSSADADTLALAEAVEELATQVLRLTESNPKA